VAAWIHEQAVEIFSIVDGFLTMTTRSTLIALAALPAALGIERPDGVGRLPALGWNSWVRQF
jgi:hypothetical protein